MCVSACVHAVTVQNAAGGAGSLKFHRFSKAKSSVSLPSSRNIFAEPVQEERRGAGLGGGGGGGAKAPTRLLEDRHGPGAAAPVSLGLNAGESRSSPPPPSSAHLHNIKVPYY